MILTDSEKILVALGALVIILAIVANAIKDYKRMTREANKKVEQKIYKSYKFCYIAEICYPTYWSAWVL